MSSEPSFDDRMFMAGQAVYETIVTGQCHDAVAALMDAHLTESTREDK